MSEKKKSTSSNDIAVRNSNLTVATTVNSTFKKKKVNVLDEETFLTKLEKIIEKDFFPDLEKLKLQQAYYEAVRNNDYDGIRDLMSKYSSIVSSEQTPSQTPAYFDTPNLQNDFFGSKKTSKEKPYANSEPPTQINLSVDKYLSQNTSEDNISFEILMAESKKKEQSKVINQWLFEKEKFHALKHESSLQLQDDDHYDDITKSLDSWPYKAKNTLMYNPDGAALTDQEQLEQVKSVRVIKHSNTRFNSNMLKSLSKSSSAAAGFTSTPSTNTPVNNQINVINKIGIDGKEAISTNTPKVKGYGFVDASPSPMPGRSFGDESPMMIWGEIEGTPFSIDPSSTPHFAKIQGAPEFKIPDVPDREKLLFDLEEKNSAARRKKKNDAFKHMQRNLASPSKKSSALADKIQSMSPAAQKLLSAKMNLKMTDSSSSPYTPKITPRSSPFNNNLTSPLNKTPSSKSIDNLRSNLKRPQSTDSLTDNLLKLPKVT